MLNEIGIGKTHQIEITSGPHAGHKCHRQSSRSIDGNFNEHIWCSECRETIVYDTNQPYGKTLVLPETPPEYRQGRWVDPLDLPEYQRAVLG